MTPFKRFPWVRELGTNPLTHYPLRWVDGAGRQSLVRARFRRTVRRLQGPTQTARSVTEAWVALHGFFPNCSADRLPQLPNDSPVADFRCGACGEEYELKAKRGKLGRSIRTALSAR